MMMSWNLSSFLILLKKQNEIIFFNDSTYSTALRIFQKGFLAQTYTPESDGPLFLYVVEPFSKTV